MNQSNALVKDIESIQLTVKRLSDAVNRCGIDWNDAQFKVMSDSLVTIASASKKIVVLGSDCENAIRRFRQIESE